SRTTLSVFPPFFPSPPPPRHLHSFPTRRASDLADHLGADADPAGVERLNGDFVAHPHLTDQVRGRHLAAVEDQLAGAGRADAERSEEHTSELQSRENLVCRLMLEKKKKRKKAHH